MEAFAQNINYRNKDISKSIEKMHSPKNFWLSLSPSTVLRNYNNSNEINIGAKLHCHQTHMCSKATKEEEN